MLKKSGILILLVIAFVAGVLGFFYECESLLAGSLSVVFLIMFMKDVCGVKVLLLAYFLFWCGVWHSDNKVFEYDDLLLSVPLKNVYVVGTVVSSPIDTANRRAKFFLEVEKVKYMDGAEVVLKTKFRDVRKEEEYLRVYDIDDTECIVEHLLKNGHVVSEIKKNKIGLEEYYIELMSADGKEGC